MSNRKSKTTLFLIGILVAGAMLPITGAFAQPLISAREAAEKAIKALEERYGKGNYKVIEIEHDDEEYEIEVTDGESRFKVKIDNRSGKIEEIEKIGEDKKGKKAEEEKPVIAKITVEQATSLAIDFLTRNFGKANYTIIKIELDEESYEVEATDGKKRFELKIDAQTGSILESKSEEEEREAFGEQPTKSMQEIIDIAKQFLVEQFGQKNYTIKEVELEDGKYEIEMLDDAGGKYEFEISATTGKIIEFEGKTRELKIEIEKEDEDELKVKVKEKKEEDGKKGFNVRVEKKEPKFKLEFEAKENITKSELGLELLFDRLIEYLDNGTSVGVFDENDTIIATIELSRLRWSVERSEVIGNNGSISAITINQTGTGDQIMKVAFVYHLTPSTKTISLANQTIASVKVWEVKFDIHIEGYNWTRTDSSLALSGKFNTELEVKVEGEKEVKFRAADGITPFFSWGGEAFADGASIEPKAEVSGNRLILSYPHFNNSLIHDPRIGYLILASLQPTEVLIPIILLVGGAIVATVLAVTSGIRSRRLRNEVLGSKV